MRRKLSHFVAPIIDFQKIATRNCQALKELPPKLQETFKLFESVLGTKGQVQAIAVLREKKIWNWRENKVEGCVCQICVRAFVDEESNVGYEADSDSAITKRLVVFLVEDVIVIAAEFQVVSMTTVLEWSIGLPNDFGVALWDWNVSFESFHVETVWRNLKSNWVCF